MKKLLWILLFVPVLSFSQAWPADSFDTYFIQDFSDNTVSTSVGSYITDAAADWDIRYSESNEFQWVNTSLIDDNKAMRVYFSDGAWDLRENIDYYTGGDVDDPNNYTNNPFQSDASSKWYPKKGTGGVYFESWIDELHSGYEEVYFSYDVYFRPGFDWSGEGCGSGKIPSLTAGQRFVPYSVPQEYHGSAFGVRWGSSGTLGLYLYYHYDPFGNPQTATSSSGVLPQGGWGTYTEWGWWEDPETGNASTSIDNLFYPQGGRWYNITVRIALNTISGGVAQADGHIETFVNGKLAWASVPGWIFRETDTITIDNIRPYTFFGGTNPCNATTAEEYMYWDNFRIWMYDESVQSVPRQDEVSDWGRTLHMPSSWSNTTMTYDEETPRVSSIPQQSIVDGESFTTIDLDDYVYDPDHTDAQMTWTYSGNTNINVDITNRIATLTYSGWTGSEDITFRATDPDTNYDETTTKFTVNQDIPGPDPGPAGKMLINFFRYETDEPANMLSSEYWNHLNGEEENDLGALHYFKNTFGENTNFTLEVMSSGMNSHSTGYFAGDLYNDSCEAGHWRIDGTGNSATLQIDGFTVGNFYHVKTYSSYAGADYGNTEVTIVDTAKQVNPYQNTTLLEWQWFADDTVENLTFEAVGDYGWLNVLEINEYYEEEDVDTITVTNILQAESYSDQAEGVVDIEFYEGGETLYSEELDAGEWIKIENVDFGSTAFNYIQYRASSSGGGVGFYLDEVTTLLGYAEVNSSGYATTSRLPVHGIEGVHDVYIYAFNSTVLLDYLLLTYKTYPASKAGGKFRTTGRGKYIKD